MTATIFARNEVRDYEAFKQMWDASDAFRVEHGTLSAGVHRDVENPNLIAVVSQFETIEAAKAFAALLDSDEFVEGPVEVGTVIPETMEYWVCEDL